MARTKRDQIGGRLPAPKDLKARGRKIWQQIVGAFPETYFTPADEWLLRLYVDQVLEYEAARKIARAVDEPEFAAKVKELSASLGQLGQKLRINPHSRTRPETAARGAAAPPVPPAPRGDGVPEWEQQLNLADDRAKH